MSGCASALGLEEAWMAVFEENSAHAIAHTMTVKPRIPMSA
jgi:hypothetical protein